MAAAAPAHCPSPTAARGAGPRRAPGASARPSAPPGRASARRRRRRLDRPRRRAPRRHRRRERRRPPLEPRVAAPRRAQGQARSPTTAAAASELSSLGAATRVESVGSPGARPGRGGSCDLRPRPPRPPGDHPASSTGASACSSRVFALAFASRARARRLDRRPSAAGSLDQLAANQHRETISIPARRGTIYDRTGVELAIGERAVTVYANPQQITRPAPGRDRRRTRARYRARRSSTRS